MAFDININVKHDVYVHRSASEPEVLARLAGLFTAITQLGGNMSQALEALRARIEANNTLVDSAITMIRGLAQQVRDLKDDPAALEALATSLEAKDAELASALSANTEASPAPTPEPAPVEPAPADTTPSDVPPQ